MNSSKSILLASVTSAALMSASLVIQAATLTAHVSQDGVETPHPSALLLAAKEPCGQYRWEHVGHPEKGYNRRVCVDKKVEPQPQAMDHDAKKCKKYVRKHHGPPGKGVDTVKVVYVQCPQKR